jgi:Flp pilus assembly protein TadG
VTAGCKQINRQKGVAAVEFAIVLPTLILLCASAVGLGTAWRTNVRLQSIASDTARLCGVRPDAEQTGCVDALVNVDTVSANCVTLNGNIVSINQAVSGGVNGEFITVLTSRVDIACEYALFPALSAVPPITLTGEAIVVVN